MESNKQTTTNNERICVFFDAMKYANAKAEAEAIINNTLVFLDDCKQNGVLAMEPDKGVFDDLLRNDGKKLKEAYFEKLDTDLYLLPSQFRKAHESATLDVKENFRNKLRGYIKKINYTNTFNSVEFYIKLNSISYDDTKKSLFVDDNKLQEFCSLYVEGQEASEFFKKAKKIETILREFNEKCKELSNNRIFAVSSYADNCGIIQIDNVGEITTNYDFVANLQF